MKEEFCYMGKGRVFYGWRIVAAGILIIGMAMGVVSNCLSVFIVPICEETGFLRGEISVTQTIMSAGGMLIAFSAGALYRKLKLKRLMEIGAITLCACYFLYSRAHSLTAFYLCACGCALGAGVCGTVPFSIIINNWFHRRAGFAVGLAFMGSGLFGMLFSFLGGFLIERIGWRATITVFSAIVACVILPCVFLVVKARPSEMGMSPYGEKEDERGACAKAEGPTFAEAARNPRFYCMAVCLFFIGIGINGFNSTLTPRLIDSGYAGPVAAGVNSVYMAMLAMGKIAIGTLSDRVGAKRACAAALVCLLLCESGLILCKSVPMLIVMLLTAGFGISISTVAVPILSHAVFGDCDFAAINGKLVAACSAGCALAPVLLGFVYDRFGSYAPGYVVLLAVIAVSSVILISFIPGKSKQYGYSN